MDLYCLFFFATVSTLVCLHFQFAFSFCSFLPFLPSSPLLSTCCSKASISDDLMEETKLRSPIHAPPTASLEGLSEGGDGEESVTQLRELLKTEREQKVCLGLVFSNFLSISAFSLHYLPCYLCVLCLLFYRTTMKS